MIDVLLYAPEKQTIIDLLRDRGLQEQYVTKPAEYSYEYIEPVLDEEGNTVTEGYIQETEVAPAEMGWRNASEVDWCWWAGSGKFMTAKGEYDQDGNQITAPEFLPGYLMMLRIYGTRFENDKRTTTKENPKQHDKSNFARTFKTAGSSKNFFEIPNVKYYEVDLVRWVDPDDCQQFLADNGLPGHQWLGGNSF